MVVVMVVVVVMEIVVVVIVVAVVVLVVVAGVDYITFGIGRFEMHNFSKPSSNKCTIAGVSHVVLVIIVKVVGGSR